VQFLRGFIQVSKSTTGLCGHHSNLCSRATWRGRHKKARCFYY